ncbi:MAG: NUDIX hydrolase [Lachnospiraceae bacterium]|nr:NUDIX hydrolase [Lachnospiraceae bacterium]
MERPKMTKDSAKLKIDGKFVRLFDLEYDAGRHYFDATRRDIDDLVAVKSDEEFLNMLPDAVSCFVILNVKDKGPLLLLDYEYRYPTGQFLLSPPAGLIDREDQNALDPLREAAVREIFEETGLTVKETDRVFTVNPLVFSSPGLTDECNALICAVVDVEDLSSLNQKGAEGTELFNGFELVDESEARAILKNGRDKNGRFYSLYTWGALMYFISGLWK